MIDRLVRPDHYADGPALKCKCGTVFERGCRAAVAEVAFHRQLVPSFRQHFPDLTADANKQS